MYPANFDQDETRRFGWEKRTKDELSYTIWFDPLLRGHWRATERHAFVVELPQVLDGKIVTLLLVLECTRCPLASRTRRAQDTSTLSHSW